MKQVQSAENERKKEDEKNLMKRTRKMRTKENGGRGGKSN
jgi:hypothetical protein